MPHEIDDDGNADSTTRQECSDLTVVHVGSPLRPYRQVARAAAASATAERILAVATRLFGERPYEQVSLEGIAAAAGVTVVTVLRRFGSKEALFAAVARAQTQQAWETLGTFAGCEPDVAVAALVGHFERYGTTILRLLGEAERLPAVADAVAYGRAAHAQWVKRAFGATPQALTTAVDRRRRWAALLAVTHVQTWRLLRLEQGLSRADTQAIMQALVRARLQQSR